jgi:O-antigen/teichoic acid export membrane protein
MYAKAIITTLISLVSVPLILKALGHSDYGLYQLIGGVIAMLSFLNASMTVATQRFLSVSMGENSSGKLNIIYNVGFISHLIIALFLFIIFEAFEPFVFSGLLNVAEERVFAAKIVYQVIILSTVSTVLSVPFDAVLNAHENLIVFAIIHIIDSVLKLILALVLIYSPIDRLIFYAIGMGLIAVLALLMKYYYIKWKYRDLQLKPRRYFDREQFKKLFGFAGWNTMGSMALIGRNQGIAVVLNVFHGTIINAAYGIANQINSLMNYLSQTLQQAINPQLMKSEGMRNRERMMRISYISCRFSVLIICLPAIPLIIEMPYVLKLWLKEVPQYTVILSQLVLTLTIVTQYSSGIQAAIQSVGKVRSYYITVSSFILLNIPISYVLLKLGLPPYYTVICFIGIEIITLVVRLVFVKKYVGISLIHYFKEVILITIITMLSGAIPSYLVHLLLPESFVRLIIVCLLYIIIYIVVAWFIALDSNQKDYFKTILTKLNLK